MPPTRFDLPNPINDTQARFAKLCALGGGPKGGPARTKVQQLLREDGKKLNELAYKEVAFHLEENVGANPWHIWFCIGMCWGNLSKNDPQFLKSAVGRLDHWNADDLKTAKQFCLQLGPDAIEQSLIGAHVLFEKVRLPRTLSNTLKGLRIAQQRCLTLILSKDRPPYIGRWNATAMFMVALFAQPTLAATLTSPDVLLPDNGPIFTALRLLHQVHFLPSPPEGRGPDDEAFEPGALFKNNSLFADILVGMPDWSVLDVHSGLYMLGTRDPRSKNWFETYHLGQIQLQP
jgi:hypothetical protein